MHISNIAAPLPLSGRGHRSNGAHNGLSIRRLLAALGASLIALAMPAMAGDAPAELTVSGPHNKDNLAVYFIHGPSRPGAIPLTLAEALKAKSVTVHETGQVQQLLVENTSDREVFVQAGDIVKGGRQDRVLTISLLLPPKSGKIPIGSYCVEQGRWAGRRGESVRSFSSAETYMPSKSAKLAMLMPRPALSTQANSTLTHSTQIQSAPAHSDELRPPRSLRLPSQQQNISGATGAVAQGNNLLSNRLGQEQRSSGLRRLPPRASAQQEVWRNVAEIQTKLSTNLATGVRSKLSASSLQLSLEHEKVIEARRNMAAALLPLAEKQKDIVGYAFAINGKINSAEIYPSNGLFKKMWPKLIKASVTEAIAERQPSGRSATPPKPDAIKAFLDSAAEGKAENARLDTVKLQRERRETDKMLSLATRRTDGTMVHRSVLAH